MMKVKVGDWVKFKTGSQEHTYKVLQLDEYNVYKLMSSEDLIHTGVWKASMFWENDTSLQEQINDKALTLEKQFKEKQKLATSLKQKLAQDAGITVATAGGITSRFTPTTTNTVSPVATGREALSSYEEVV